jgi:hypothetical protein
MKRSYVFPIRIISNRNIVGAIATACTAFTPMLSTLWSHGRAPPSMSTKLVYAPISAMAPADSRPRSTHFLARRWCSTEVVGWQ